MDEKVIEGLLLKAESPEEIGTIFTENEIEVSPETINDIYKRVSWLNKVHSGAIPENELSEDELMAVTGGRDYATEGCKATVEYDSRCWGEDGGCALIHFSYEHEPKYFPCKNCGKQMLYVYAEKQGIHGDLFRCRNCGAEYTTWNVWG